MKKIFLYLAVIAAVVAAAVSCSPAEKEFNEQLLIGYWKSGTDNMHFAADHTGAWWDSAETPDESYATKTQWSLSGDALSIKLCFQDVGGCDVPKSYTVTELSATKFVFTDGYKSRSFTKND
jgi:hypothetical protein